MKKKRLFSRVGGALLALALVVSMCVSPLSAVKAEAADDESIIKDESVSVVSTVSGESLVFEEGEEYDVSQYFTINYNGTIPYMVGWDSYYMQEAYGNYYGAYKDLFVLNYTGVGETIYSSTTAPTEAGDYEVTATFPTSTSVAGYIFPTYNDYLKYYNDTSDTSSYYLFYNGYVYNGYTYVIGTPSATIRFTIEGTSEPDNPSDDPDEPSDPSDDPVEEAVVEIKPNAAEGYKVAPGTDMSQYFALWDKEYSTMINYMYDSQSTSYGWDNSVSDVFEMSYTDENGESVTERPTTPGVYYAKASLPIGSYTCYILQNNAWVTPAPVYTVSGDVSATLKYEVVADGATADLVVSADIPETVKAGTDMAPYFTYTFRGREVELLYQDPDGTYENYKTYIANPTEDDLNYGYLAQEDAFVMHYYKLDKDGNVLEDLGSEVPEEAGTYKVTAELTDYTEDGGFYTVYVLWTGSNDTSEYYDYYGGVIGEGIYTIEAADEPVEEPDEPVVDPDEPVVDPDEPVADPDEPSKGDTDTDVDDTNDVTTDKDKTADTTKTSDSTKTSAKTGDTTPLALYIVLIVACGIVVAAMVQRRRKNA